MTSIRNLQTKINYLQRDIKYGSNGPVGVILTFAVVVSLILTYVAQEPAEFLKQSISYLQLVQILTIINMNIPDDYIAFARYFEISQLNFNFFDFLTLQEEMETKTRRNLMAGERSLLNLNFQSSNLFVEYIYFFVILILIIISHFVFKIIMRNKELEEESTLKIIADFFKNLFEFKIYINLILYTC